MVLYCSRDLQDTEEIRIYVSPTTKDRAAYDTLMAARVVAGIVR